MINNINKILDDFVVTNNLKGSVEQYIEKLLNKRGEIVSSSVDVCTGYNVTDTKYPKVNYLSNGNIVNKCKAKFGTSRRRANVYGKRTWEGLVLVDLSYNTIRPVEYIEVKCVV